MHRVRGTQLGIWGRFHQRGSNNRDPELDPYANPIQCRLIFEGLETLTADMGTVFD